MAKKQVDIRRALNVIIAVLVGGFALLYVFSPGDIIPDKAGLFGPQKLIGYLDDAIAVMFSIFFMRKLKVLTFPTDGVKKFNPLWFMVFASLLGSALFYLFWGYDMIPDGTPYVGFFDDIAVFIGVFKVIGKVRHWFKNLE